MGGCEAYDVQCPLGEFYDYGYPGYPNPVDYEAMYGGVYGGGYGGLGYGGYGYGGYGMTTVGGISTMPSYGGISTMPSYTTGLTGGYQNTVVGLGANGGAIGGQNTFVSGPNGYGSQQTIIGTSELGQFTDFGGVSTMPSFTDFGGVSTMPSF